MTTGNPNIHAIKYQIVTTQKLRVVYKINMLWLIKNCPQKSVLYEFVMISAHMILQKLLFPGFLWFNPQNTNMYPIEITDFLNLPGLFEQLLSNHEKILKL